MEIIKKTLYPKTPRLGEERVIVTEKLDGSNLGIFRSKNGLLIAQRNYIFKWTEKAVSLSNKEHYYKGLFSWLQEHGKELMENMHIGSGIFGEWIGMGKINYRRLEKKFYIFAKANLTEEEDDIKNLYYDRDLFIYPFKDQIIPEFIGVVPVVAELTKSPSIEELNKMYIRYVLQLNEYTLTDATEIINKDGTNYAIVDINYLPEKVEGFVINSNNTIYKYVRFKNGRSSEHELPKV